MNRTTKIIIAAAAVLAVAAIAFFGIRNQMRKNTGDGSVIRIGAVLPLTGAFAFEGQKAAAAIKLAADEINASSQGGPKVKLLLEDGKFTVKDSISAYRKLAEANPQGVITFGTPTTAAIKDILKPGEIMMAIDGTRGVPQSSEMVFRCLQPTSHVAIAMVKLLEREKIKNVSVAYMDGDSGRDFIDAFSKAFSGKINAAETFAFDSQDVRAAISKLTKHRNDAICVFGYGMGYATTLNQLIESGFKGRIITDLNVTSISGNLKNNGLGIRYVSLVFGNDSRNELSKSFIKKLEKRYSTTPTAFSAFAYEAARMLALAFGENRSAEGAKSFLLNLKQYGSVVGNISYDKDGELCLPFSVYEISGPNKFTYLYDLPTIGL